MPTPTTLVVFVIVLFPFEKPTIVRKAAARDRPLLGQLNDQRDSAKIKHNNWGLLARRV